MVDAADRGRSPVRSNGTDSSLEIVLKIFFNNSRHSFRREVLLSKIVQFGELEVQNVRLRLASGPKIHQRPGERAEGPVEIGRIGLLDELLHLV